jgi:hypothetical protein
MRKHTATDPSKYPHTKHQVTAGSIHGKEKTQKAEEHRINLFILREMLQPRTFSGSNSTSAS